MNLSKLFETTNVFITVNMFSLYVDYQDLLLSKYFKHLSEIITLLYNELFAAIMSVKPLVSLQNMLRFA